MEKHNLRWNPDRKKHELSFDIKELAEFEFLDSYYLGKEKHCVSKSSAGVEGAREQELVEKNRLMKEYSHDISGDITVFLKQTVAAGIVFIIHRLA